MSTMPLTPLFVSDCITYMPQLIQDEFTNMPISRQRKYQLRHKKQRRCKSCSKKLRINWPYMLCPKHRQVHLVTLSKANKLKQILSENQDIL